MNFYEAILASLGLYRPKANPRSSWSEPLSVQLGLSYFEEVWPTRLLSHYWWWHDKKKRLEHMARITQSAWCQDWLRTMAEASGSITASQKRVNRYQ